MADINKEFLDDLFNIPRNGSNIVDDDEADAVPGSSTSASEIQVPFDEKAKDIAADITKAIAAPIESVKEEKATVETAIKKVVAETKGKGFDDLLADVMAAPVVQTKPQKAEAPLAPAPEVKVALPEPAPQVIELPPIHISVDEVKDLSETIAKKVKEAVDSAGETTETPINTVAPRATESTKLTKSGHSWKLTSPATKYDYFYSEKAFTLTNYLLKDGEIPFNDYYKELGDANVDVNVPTYDAEEVGRRITEVMQWRDRIKHIQLHTNAQFFVWKQYMDLLPGVMARIEYASPAIKQEGVLYEHMNDMYGYFGSLEGLHKSCEVVSKHLDAAYNSLSRQVAIAQPMQEVERFTNPPRPMTAQLSKFDGVTKQTSGSSATGRLKQAANAAEPKAKSFWEKQDSNG